MNPCPCGYFGDKQRDCTCSPASIVRYQKRLSGPLLDRIDIHLEVPQVEYEKLSADRSGERSEAVRRRVDSAKTLQRRRFEGGMVQSNSEMTLVQVRDTCKLDQSGGDLMRSAMDLTFLSAGIPSGA